LSAIVAGRTRHFTAAARLAALVFFFLAAVLALATTAGNATAAPLSTTQNRVEVPAPISILAVGVAEHITAGRHPDRGPPQLRPAEGCCVAAETELGSGSTSLFRAISGGEADDIAANGFRQAANGRSYEGKLFATSAEDAARFGRINYGLDQEPFSIAETRVPNAFLDQLYSGTADRMPFVGVDPGQLAELNELGRTSIWDSVPWVAKP
jgi:hypothetical protein